MCLSLTLLYPIARWSLKALAGASADGRFARHVKREHAPHRDGNLQQLLRLFVLSLHGSVIAEPARERFSVSGWTRVK